MISLYAKTAVDEIGGLIEDNAFILGKSLLGDGSVFAEADKKMILIGKRNKRSIEVDILSRDNIEAPSWGIISNSGTVSFIDDAEGSLYKYASSGALRSGYPIEIFCENTITKKSERIAYMFTEKWNYNNSNRNVSVSIKDDIEKLQDVQFSEIELDRSATLYEIYEIFKSSTESFGFSFAPLKEEVRFILKNTTIEFPIISSGNLWDKWDSLCKASCIYIYKNKDNQIELNYYYGG
jgi:hypothetical protein